jgi:CheY-like chemotaxis protein
MPLSILIVDDHPEVADSLADLLACYGHETRVARDGGEAIEVAVNGRFDVVILDIILPDGEGYTVAGRLREAMANRPLLIAVTGLPNLEGWSRAKGFDHHFVKPVEPAVLRDLLAGYADQLAQRE